MSDIFQIKPLIAWLESKPPDGEYNFYDRESCLLTQYLTSIGHVDAEVGGWSVTIDGTRHLMPDDFSNIPCEQPHTFGAALARALLLDRAE